MREAYPIYLIYNYFLRIYTNGLCLVGYVWGLCLEPVFWSLFWEGRLLVLRIFSKGVLLDQLQLLNLSLGR